MARVYQYEYRRVGSERWEDMEADDAINLLQNEMPTVSKAICEMVMFGEVKQVFGGELRTKTTIF